MQTRIIPQARAKDNLLILSYLAFAAVGLPTGLMGVAWPTLRAEFALPLDALGLLLISTTIGFLISSFLIARLISRFGIGSLLIVSGFLSAACFLGYTLAPSWTVIIIIGSLAGFGLGLTDAGLNTYLASEYHEGQMQWLHASFGAGATLSPLIMTASLSLFTSWRPAYLLVALLMVVLAVYFMLTHSIWRRPSPLSNSPAGSEAPDRGLMDYRTSLWKTLIRVGTWVGILLFLLYTGAELTLGNWSYTLLTEGRGVSPQIAGVWAGGFWAIFTIGRVLAGLNSHRFRPNRMVPWAMILALVGALLFWWNMAVWVGVAGLFIVGFAMAPIFPGLISSTSQRVGPRHAANTIGIQMSAAGLGGALLPSLAGYLAEHISLEAIPVMLLVSLLGLLVLYWLSTRVSLAE